MGTTGTYRIALLALPLLPTICLAASCGAAKVETGCPADSASCGEDSLVQGETPRLDAAADDLDARLTDGVEAESRDTDVVRVDEIRTPEDGPTPADTCIQFEGECPPSDWKAGLGGTISYDGPPFEGGFTVTLSFFHEKPLSDNDLPFAGQMMPGCFFPIQFFMEGHFSGAIWIRAQLDLGSDHQVESTLLYPSAVEVPGDQAICEIDFLFH
jgi:hypothetical protein